MAKAFSLTIDAASVVVAPSESQSRAKFAYVDGKRTNVAVVSANGKPVFAFQGIAELGGQRLGDVRIESNVELPANLPLGALLQGSGSAELRVRPEDNFSLAVTIYVENIAPARTSRGE